MTLELSLTTVLAVAGGGALGAVGRFLLDRYLRAGVLIANTVGCLLLGSMIGASAASGGQWDPWVVGLLAMGFCGALSTFATVALRAAQKWTSGARWQAIGLWAGHSVCGIAAGAAGLALGWNIAASMLVDVM